MADEAGATPNDTGNCIAELQDAVAAPDAQATFKKLLSESQTLAENIKKSMAAREAESSVPSLSSVTAEDMPTVVRATTLALQAAQRDDDVDCVVRAAVEVVTSDRAKVNQARQAREEKRRAYAKQVEMDRKRYLLECEALAAERDKLAEARRALASDRAAVREHVAKLSNLDAERKEMKKEREALHALIEKLADTERKRLTDAAKRDGQIAAERRAFAEGERKRLADAAKRDAQSAELERNRRTEAAKKDVAIAAERKELEKLRKEIERGRDELEKRIAAFEKRRIVERNEMKQYLEPLCHSTTKLTQAVSHIQQALSHARIEMASKPKVVVDSPKVIPRASRPSSEPRSAPKNTTRTPSKRTEPRSSSRAVVPSGNRVMEKEVAVSEEQQERLRDSDSSAEPHSAAPSSSPLSRAVVVAKKTVPKASRRSSTDAQNDTDSRALAVSKPRRMSELERLQASLATARWVDDRELEKKIASTKVPKSSATDETEETEVSKKRNRADTEERSKATPASRKKKKRKSVTSTKKPAR